MLFQNTSLIKLILKTFIPSRKKVMQLKGSTTISFMYHFFNFLCKWWATMHLSNHCSNTYTLKCRPMQAIKLNYLWFLLIFNANKLDILTTYTENSFFLNYIIFTQTETFTYDSCFRAKTFYVSIIQNI